MAKSKKYLCIAWYLSALLASVLGLLISSDKLPGIYYPALAMVGLLVSELIRRKDDEGVSDDRSNNLARSSSFECFFIHIGICC